MNLRTAIAAFALVVVMPQGHAQTNTPIPSEIGSSKSVFVSNAGGEANSISEQAYSVLYAGLKQWNHYRLTSEPSSADLILELHYTSPANFSNVINGDSLGPPFLPRFQLIIIDKGTHTILWSVTEFPFSEKGKKNNFDQNNENAVNALLSDLKVLAAGKFPSAASALTPSTSTRLSDEGKK